MLSRGGAAAIVVLSVCALAAGARSAWAAPAATGFHIQQQSLSNALIAFAHQANVEILVDPALVQNLNAPPVRGRLSVEEALTEILAGSGIGFRATGPGEFALYALHVRRASDPGDGAVSEVLIVGRRTQNADIRRTVNDIQPYIVASAQDIEETQSDNADDFMRNRVSANAEIVSPTQNVLNDGGDTRSAFDLRGFGSRQTLVLIDGQRMPGLPSNTTDFDQTDVNPLPLDAVERIETLTSAAGGIYGPGAVGGVVNFVLKRDLRGAGLSVSSGISDRGDAGEVHIDGWVGFSPDHGDTEVMVSASHSATEPFLTGQRDYAMLSRQRQIANDPADYIAQQQASNSIGFFSEDGPLTFNPQFGGGALNASYTFLPLNFTGTAAQRAALLAGNAGKIDASLPLDGTGALASLTNQATTNSVMFNIRHHFSSGIDIFIDGIYLDDVGRYSLLSPIYPPPELMPGAPGNPFAQTVYLTLPQTGYSSGEDTETEESSRLTSGAIVPLPFGWKAIADVAVGDSQLGLSGYTLSPGYSFDPAIATGGPGPGGLPSLNPLGNWPAFLAAARSYSMEFSVYGGPIVDQFSSASLRLGGPVAALPGGPLTLTLLGEWRREHIPGPVFVEDFDGFQVQATEPERTEAVASTYAELRAPLVAADSRFVPLRGLELQFAVRYDDTFDTFPEDANFGESDNDQLISVRHDTVTYTAGARVFPINSVMLRASVATGSQPPSLSALEAQQYETSFDYPPIYDPKRGNEEITTEGSYLLITNGSRNIKPARAQTFSAGVVWNPLSDRGPRLSIDYSRTLEDEEDTPFPLTGTQLLQDEAQYPGRVVRAPLTPADMALGYTAGRVIALSLQDINGASTLAEAVDFQLDWSVSAGSIGRFRFHGGATWEPTFKQRAAPSEPWIEEVGYIDGPLAWRGNAAVEWTRGATEIDLTTQFFAGYRPAYLAPGFQSDNAVLLLDQPHNIPPQIYFNLGASHHFKAAGVARVVKDIQVRLDIQDLFDTRPPLIADPDSEGYSTYGDPRRRRFVLTVSSRF